MEMLTPIQIPHSFSLIKKGETLLLLKDEYKDILLQHEIEKVEPFLKKHHQNTHYFSGRTSHPSISFGGGRRIVLRRYLHGGLLGPFTRDLFVFGSRSFRELALTEEIRTCGIPTIQPIGAIHRSILPPFYKAYLLSLEIQQSMNLIQYLQEIVPSPSLEKLQIKRKMIKSIGFLLQKFHQEGFFHGDLQLKNILVAEGQPFLIDFDRSYRKGKLSLKERMKNILRLNRSLEKWRRFGLPITKTDRWRFFSAYAGGDVKIREEMSRVIQTYSIRYLFYRWGWALERMLRFK